MPSAIDAYAHCETLTREQWAWEFLRRNPEYQADYRQFIDIWQTLEAEYGTPPHRDFLRWKQDPRAYGPLPGDTERAIESATGEFCLGENERVFIECWMGAKWGFYKFPLDPQRDMPPGLHPPPPTGERPVWHKGADAGPNPIDEISFRPPPAPAPRKPDDPYRLDIAFDLSLPLPPQLEAAKFRLVGRAAELRRAGHTAPLSVASQRTAWTRLLRVLDAHAAGANIADLCASGWCEDEARCARLLSEAQAMTQTGYLAILRLAD